MKATALDDKSLSFLAIPPVSLFLETNLYRNIIDRSFSYQGPRFIKNIKYPVDRIAGSLVIAINDQMLLSFFFYLALASERIDVDNFNYLSSLERRIAAKLRWKDFVIVNDVAFVLDINFIKPVESFAPNFSSAATRMRRSVETLSRREVEIFA